MLCIYLHVVPIVEWNWWGPLREICANRRRRKSSGVQQRAVTNWVETTLYRFIGYGSGVIGQCRTKLAAWYWFLTVQLKNVYRKVGGFVWDSAKGSVAPCQKSTWAVPTSFFSNRQHSLTVSDEPCLWNPSGLLVSCHCPFTTSKREAPLQVCAPTKHSDTPMNCTKASSPRHWFVNHQIRSILNIFIHV